MTHRCVLPHPLRMEWRRRTWGAAAHSFLLHSQHSCALSSFLHFLLFSSSPLSPLVYSPMPTSASILRLPHECQAWPTILSTPKESATDERTNGLSKENESQVATGHMAHSTKLLTCKYSLATVISIALSVHFHGLKTFISACNVLCESNC